MQSLKNIKTGEVYDLSKKDMAFINGIFEPVNEAEEAAASFMRKARAARRKAFESIKTKWPELEKFDYMVDNVENQLIITGPKPPFRAKRAFTKPLK